MLELSCEAAVRTGVGMGEWAGIPASCQEFSLI